MDENKLYAQYLHEMCLREKYGSKNNITFDEWKRIKSAMGNTQLTTSPELSATTLSDCCYTNLFNGCANMYLRKDGLIKPSDVRRWLESYARTHYKSDSWSFYSNLTK